MAECCHHDHATPGTADADMWLAIDPVCGMQVDTRTASRRYRLGETEYYYCSAGCLNKFKADPTATLIQRPATRR